MMPQRGSWNPSPPLISPPLLIILLPILALTLLFLTVPPLLSAATNILRPASVKTSWDSLNILIVVFAILFGVFARRNDDEQPPTQNTNDVVQHQNDAYISVSSEGSGISGSGYDSQQWCGFSEERKVYDDDDVTLNRLRSPVTGVTRLRRRSSSYPDLRQWTTDDDSYKFRFYDDLEIDKQFRSPAREQFDAVDHRKRWPEDRKQEEDQVIVKEIPVDTFENRPSPPVKSPAPAPPPPPPPPPVPPQNSAPRHRHPRQMHRKVESVKEITEMHDREFIEVQFPPRDPPTPPPPRPSAKTRSEQRSGKSSEKRKSNVKREIAMVWASVLSNQRKRKKKQRTKNDHHYDNDEVNESTNNTIAPPTPPPPPPPLPPPPSVFHSIFRKGLGKNKKIHSVLTPTPPAPPPPPSLTSSKRWSKRKNQIPPQPPTPPRRGNTGKPPLPNKTSNIINERITAVGNQSPLIPPPPPPPPFKIAAMKFSVRGDFVKIRSNESSRCSSPEREHIDVEVSETTATRTSVTVTTVNNAVTDNNCHVSGSVFCPSPDVNVKAASFIARLRGEWRLEKLNSIKEKGNASLPLARGYSL